MQWSNAPLRLRNHHELEPHRKKSNCRFSLQKNKQSQVKIQSFHGQSNRSCRGRRMAWFQRNLKRKLI